MALLTPGYFQNTAFPKSFWAQDYWPEATATVAALVSPGYLHSTLFTRGYWMPDYWLEYGVSAPVYALLTPGYWHENYFSRAYFAQDYWLEWGEGILIPIPPEETRTGGSLQSASDRHDWTIVAREEDDLLLDVIRLFLEEVNK